MLTITVIQKTTFYKLMCKKFFSELLKSTINKETWCCRQTWCLIELNDNKINDPYSRLQQVWN